MQIEAIRRMAHDIIENAAIESDCIEYKKSATFKNKILKTVCAFANNYMNREIGLLFIGVEEVDDKETGEKAYPKRPIYGVPTGKLETTENELKSLIANVHPKVNYHLISDTIDGNNYIVVAVEPGHDGPYETSDKAEKDKEISLKAGRYIRVKRDSRVPNKREEFELLKKFADFHFSSELNETATIDDLSYDYMQEYLIATNARSDTRKLSKLELAKHMGLISQSEYGGYRAKNFAVLMFAEKPDKFIPEATVKVIREVVGTDKMEAKTFDGPIWIQAKQVSKYFQDNIMSSYTVRESDVIEHRIVYNWPLQTFEELATNCILHKEYDKPQYIGIYVYPDHLIFINHNRPLPPVTIEDMNIATEFPDRMYLNPEIKEMFFKLDLIESYGSGIKRAKEELETNHSPQVVFGPSNEMDDYTQATVYINDEFARIQKEEKVNRDNDLGGTQQVTPQVTQQVTPQVKQKAIEEKILEFCKIERSRNEIAEHCGYRDVRSFSAKYIKPLLADERLRMTIPEKPNSSQQRYLTS